MAVAAWTFVRGCWQYAVKMLRAETIFDHGGVSITDVACDHPRGRGEETEQRGGHAIVFVRRGCFVRYADGARCVLDATVAYCMRPGEEERFDHPHAGGDDCTAVTIEPALLTQLWGGDPTLPRQPNANSSRHRPRTPTIARRGSVSGGRRRAVRTSDHAGGQHARRC